MSKSVVQIEPLTYLDLVDGKSVKSIGDWDVGPPHVTPKCDVSHVPASNSLTSFIRSECACWYSYGKRCIGINALNVPFTAEEPCWVMFGKPCNYFKKYVLCEPDYKYPPYAFQQNPDYEKKVRRLYGKIDNEEVEITGRRCTGIYEGKECGAPLLPRRRYCNKCRNRRREDSYRKHRGT